MTDAPKPEKPRTWGRLLTLGGWILLATFLFSLFGKQFFLADILSNFRVHFLIALTIGLLLSLKSNRGWLLKLSLAIATGWAGFQIASLWFAPPQPTPGKTQIRIMSFNVLATNEQFSPAIFEIRKHDPDVVAVLEYANQWHDACEFITEQFPYSVRIPRWHGYGIAVFSKLPFKQSQSVQLTKTIIDVPAIEATVTVDGKDIRIFAVHTVSPINQFRWDIRNEQLEEIATWINESHDSTVVVGDFNMAPWSWWNQNFLANTGLRESRPGFGPQATWPSLLGPLAVPIDYAFVSHDIHVHNRFIGANVGSDHRPVIVDLSVSE